MPLSVHDPGRVRRGPEEGADPHVRHAGTHFLTNLMCNNIVYGFIRSHAGHARPVVFQRDEPDEPLYVLTFPSPVSVYADTINQRCDVLLERKAVHDGDCRIPATREALPGVPGDLSFKPRVIHPVKITDVVVFSAERRSGPRWMRSARHAVGQRSPGLRPGVPGRVHVRGSERHPARRHGAQPHDTSGFEGTTKTNHSFS